MSGGRKGKNRRYTGEGPAKGKNTASKKLPNRTKHFEPSTAPQDYVRVDTRAIRTTHRRNLEEHPVVLKALEDGKLSVMPARDSPDLNPSRFDPRWEDGASQSRYRTYYIPTGEHRTRGVSFVEGVAAQVDYGEGPGDTPKIVSAFYLSGGGAGYNGIPRAAMPGVSMADLEKRHASLSGEAKERLGERLNSGVPSAFRVNFGHKMTRLSGKSIWRQRDPDGTVSNGAVIVTDSPRDEKGNRSALRIHSSNDAKGSAAWRQPKFIRNHLAIKTAGCLSGSGKGTRLFLESQLREAGVDFKPDQSYTSLFHLMKRQPLEYRLRAAGVDFKPTQSYKSLLRLAEKNAKKIATAKVDDMHSYTYVLHPNLFDNKDWVKKTYAALPQPGIVAATPLLSTVRPATPLPEKPVAAKPIHLPQGAVARARPIPSKRAEGSSPAPRQETPSVTGQARSPEPATSPRHGNYGTLFRSSRNIFGLSQSNAAARPPNGDLPNGSSQPGSKAGTENGAAPPDPKKSREPGPGKTPPKTSPSISSP